MLRDIFRQKINKGDTVAFAHAGRGAKPFEIGVVVRCMPKSVEISYFTDGLDTAHCIRTANAVVKEI